MLTNERRRPRQAAVPRSSEVQLLGNSILVASRHLGIVLGELIAGIDDLDSGRAAASRARMAAACADIAAARLSLRAARP